MSAHHFCSGRACPEQSRTGAGCDLRMKRRRHACRYKAAAAEMDTTVIRRVLCGRRARSRYGNAVPDLLLTSPISPLLSVPSAFTSLRKFDASTVCPDLDYVWLISAELTVPSPFVSAINIPTDIGTELLLPPAESFTFVRVTVITCALLTPVRLTM